MTQVAIFHPMLPSFFDLPVLLLYAEIHFRFFPNFPSLLYRREPEITFDLPRRIDPGSDLPVALLFNDIHRYPVSVNEVAIAVSTSRIPPQLFKFKNLEDHQIKHSLDDQLRAFIFEIPRSKLPEGQIHVNATVSITRKHRTWTVLNDNLFSSSKAPFKCRVCSETLPGNEFCTYGDLHNHSIYSQSHVEFGPPIKIYDRMASASGLEFIGITDHSYDLACKRENYLEQDKALTKWKLFLQDSMIDHKTIIIPGEEISCLNKDGKVVHLCGLGLNDFISGTLDGARKNTVFSQQLTINQAINEIHKQGGIAFAAHPGSHAGLLQSLLLHRGSWSEDDCSDKLDGFQALNSGYHRSWYRSKSMWINLLKRGLRVPLLGGNDAHGDFNRYRATSIPFLSIYEGFNRYMGFGKSGIYGKKHSSAQILDGICDGAVFITNGPFISINRSLTPFEPVISNTSIDTSGLSSLIVYAKSTAEFGRLQKLNVFLGGPSKSERLLMKKYFKENIYEAAEPVPLTESFQNCYLRAEVVSILDDDTTFEGYSNPCYLQ
jgi:hypothetical protein